MKVVFYNMCGNGDLHYTREFIKDIISQMPGNEFYYSHRKDEKVLFDLKLNQPEEKKDILNRILYFNNITTLVENGVLFIHTWIGQIFMKYYNIKNCSLYSNYELYKDIYKILNLNIKNIEYYIPSIDYSQLNLEKIDEVTKNDRKKILICNGNILSGQSHNFEFNPIIERLYVDHKDVDFFLTDDSKGRIISDNIFYTNDFKVDDKSDLNEISYLSTKCDIIVGRASGAYCFTHVKENLSNPNKKFISFCHNKYEGIWFESVSCKNIWSNDYNEDNIYYKINIEL